jgi:hypothetical protein
MASTTVFGDSSVSLHPAKSHYYASQASLPRVPGYDNYLASGPNSAVGHDIELSRMDSINEPLLTPRMGYYQHQGASQASISTPPSLYQEPMMTGGREAPLHRPQGDMSPQYPPQQYPPQPYHQQHPSQQSLRSQSPGPQRMMTPNPGQMMNRNMSPAPQMMNSTQRSMSPAQRMMTPNPSQQQQWGPNPTPPSEPNMAGRGVFRG